MYNHLICARKFNFVNLPVVFLYFNILILMVSCKSEPTEHYGFITKLGNDTISVENVKRQGNTITSDEIDRFPAVRVRNTVINLKSDGSIEHLVMNIHTPGETPDKRECKVVGDVTNNKVHISKTDGTGTLKLDFNTGGSIVVAHVPQMYSLYEIYFVAALKHAAASKLAAGSTVDMRQFYIDREFDKFPLGRAHVTLRENNKLDVTHDWLSGTGEATMDSNYQMLDYSGDRTTYKVTVKRVASSFDIKSIAKRFELLETKAGTVKSLSVRDTTRAQIGNAIFMVDYSRPLMRGRKLLGDVISYNYVWRTGANAATQFTTSVPIKLAGMQVPAGTYTLWTIPYTDSVVLIVNKQTGQWGTEYNKSRDLGTAKITSETLTTPVEAFTISFVPVDEKHGTLKMEWGFFKWTAPIELE